MASLRVQFAQAFDREGRKEVLTTSVGILFLLATSGKLCCSTCLTGRTTDAGFNQERRYTSTITLCVFYLLLCVLLRVKCC